MNRIRPIQIKVTSEEYDKIEEKAKKLNLSVSAYLRMVGIHGDINVTVKIGK